MLKRINNEVYIWVKIENVNSILLQFRKYMYTHTFSYKNVYLFTSLLSWGESSKFETTNRIIYY